MSKLRQMTPMSWPKWLAMVHLRSDIMKVGTSWDVCTVRSMNLNFSKKFRSSLGDLPSPPELVTVSDAQSGCMSKRKQN